jgi:DNA-binding FrmR family transcriptional regulator
LRFLSLFLVFSFIPMVDVHSVAASSHPSHREREYERETTSQSRMGRLRRTRGRTYATTVMLESQPQCTTGTTASLSAVAGLDAVLLATHQLLNSQPPTGHHPQRSSSGVTMSTSSSLPPSTRHNMRGNDSHLRSSRAFHQRRVCHPWHRHPQCCQVRALQRSIALRWPATR